MATRHHGLRRAVSGCALSVAWALVAGAAALAAGLVVGSVALVGIALTAASVLVLPVLARAKLRLAKQLGSAALPGDGVLSLAVAALAAATLVSLLVESAFNWWWVPRPEA